MHAFLRACARLTGLPRLLRVAQVRLWPGWTVDLSGGGRDLYYQVYRDAHAHA
jgi:hypothetical protein